MVLYSITGKPSCRPQSSAPSQPLLSPLQSIHRLRRLADRHRRGNKSALIKNIPRLIAGPLCILPDRMCLNSVIDTPFRRNLCLYYTFSVLGAEQDVPSEGCALRPCTEATTPRTRNDRETKRPQTRPRND